jgi:hypothetical protein
MMQTAQTITLRSIPVLFLEAKVKRRAILYQLLNLGCKSQTNHLLPKKYDAAATPAPAAATPAPAALRPTLSLLNTTADAPASPATDRSVCCLCVPVAGALTGPPVDPATARAILDVGYAAVWAVLPASGDRDSEPARVRPHGWTPYGCAARSRKSSGAPRRQATCGVGQGLEFQAGQRL